LRASVGSTEAILPERPRSLSSALWGPVGHRTGRIFSRRVGAIGLCPSRADTRWSGSLIRQVRCPHRWDPISTESAAPDRWSRPGRVPRTPCMGRARETAAISGGLVAPSRNGDHRRQPYDHQKCRSHPGQGRATDVNWAAMGKIGKAVWWSLSLGPAFAARGLEGILARLLAYEYPIPA
jgi:hypothetical protein